MRVGELQPAICQPTGGGAATRCRHFAYALATTTRVGEGRVALLRDEGARRAGEERRGRGGPAARRDVRAVLLGSRGQLE